MIYVGIDIAKDKHDYVILDERGIVIQQSSTITNTQRGFESLLACIQNLEPNLANVRVGLESTGHYGHNLLGFLVNQNATVYLLNPLRTKQYHGCLSLRKTKTDKVDAETIARMIMADQTLQPYTLQAYHKEELKSLTRYRASKVRDRTRLKNAVARLVNILFPELEVAFCSLHTVSSYKILSTYPGATHITEAHVANLTKMLQEASRGRFGAEKATQIHNLAKNSIGTSMPAKSLELQHTIKLIQYLDQEISEIEDHIRQLVDSLSSPILSIPGIGYTTGAVILAEIGDFASFSSPDKIIAYAGYSPTIYQSGQYTSNNHARMEKRGSAYLRKALYDATKAACRFIPSFTIYLAKKRAEGKHYNVAISHAAKRLMRLIYAMEKSGQNYRPSLQKY